MEPRPLLPKPRGSEPSAFGPLGVANSQLLPKRNKAPGRTSCDTCRRRKTACGAQRPVCSACQARGSECSYKNRDKLGSLEFERGILERLRTLPENESIALLQKLRTQGTPFVSPTAVSDGEQQSRGQLGETPAPSGPMSPLVSGPTSTLKQPLATTASGITLELMARYPIGYPTLLPFDIESINIEAIVEPSNPSGGNIEYPYCDERLSHLDISKWSSVQVGNKLAARIISSYLRMDHPLLGLFDADLFLRDLICLQPNFCSSMLVNAVLAWSCQSYSSREPTAGKHKVAFLDEAIKLWDEEDHRNTVTSVAAAHLITLTASCHGQHDVAAHFNDESIAMSKRMGLYGATEEGCAKQWLDNHQEWIRAASHTSWGAYCAITMLSLRDQTALVEAAPLLPIPSKVGAVIERVKGERFESYPTPAYMGQTFNKLCELYQIAHEILWTYYGGDKSDSQSSNGDSPASRVNIEFAEEKLRELLEWSSSLPLELVWTDTGPHRVILLHTYFHCLILDLIRPFYLNTEQHRFSSFEASQPEGDIEAFYQASMSQLKRLVLFLTTKMETPTACILWQTSLVYLFNDLLREYRTSNSKCKETAQWNFYFRLCIAGFKRNFHCFVLTQEVVKGLLSMAVRDRVLEASEAEGIFDNLRETALGLKRKRSDENKKAHDAMLVLDLDLAMTDREQATLSAVTADFHMLAMHPGAPSDRKIGDERGSDVGRGNQRATHSKPARQATSSGNSDDRPSSTTDSGGKRSGEKPPAPDEGFPTEDLSD